jgi:hypothetical protein
MRLDTTPATYVLFLDLEEVESSERLEQVINVGAKHPENPVLSPGPPGSWDCVRAKCYGTVLYDPTCEGALRCAPPFRMYYSGASDVPPFHRSIGYAESGDGVHWERPALGVVEHNGYAFGRHGGPRRGPSHGSTQNNIIIAYGQAPSVFLDEQEPDERKRYKCVYTPGGPTLGGLKAYSPDGLRWQTFPDSPAWTPSKNERGAISVDEHHSLVIDPNDPERRFKSYCQVNTGYYRSEAESRRFERAIGLVSSPDFVHWSPCLENPILDPKDGVEDQDHMACVTLYRGLYVMLYDFMYENSSCDTELAVSRDGVHFRRIQNGRKLIPLGEKGEWDGSCICVSNNFLVVGDEFWFYYTGSPENYNEAAYRADPHEHAFFRHTGLARWRLDGFAHVQARGARGEASLLTKPLQVKSAEKHALSVNADCSRPGSSLRVGLLDAASKEPVPGFTIRECDAIRGDSVRHKVTWRGRETLQGLRGGEVRLRFGLHAGARLYSFTFPRAGIS